MWQTTRPAPPRTPKNWRRPERPGAGLGPTPRPWPSKHPYNPRTAPSPPYPIAPAFGPLKSQVTRPTPPPDGPLLKSHTPNPLHGLGLTVDYSRVGNPD